MKRAAIVALAFVALMAKVSGQAGCPDGYINFSTDSATLLCLKFVTYAKGTYDSLRAMCQAMPNGDLAQLQLNCDLHHRVYEYIIQHADLKGENFWIGGSDAGHEGIWKWVNGEEMEMGVPHWYPGQPDGEYDENYACLAAPDYFYHSCNNNNYIYAICHSII
ncbi:perlucin-like protein [Procambarus clarkii]|uniref:perlucin-like protein n=1 Tax=Procambarus clarkii TaxID=6728 RepID=UPI001E675D8A|nr:perlucin-like protein [Procambarus clarkii]